jgi:hypothetical protein
LISFHHKVRNLAGAVSPHRNQQPKMTEPLLDPRCFGDKVGFWYSANKHLRSLHAIIVARLNGGAIAIGSASLFLEDAIANEFPIWASQRTRCRRSRAIGRASSSAIGRARRSSRPKTEVIRSYMSKINARTPKKSLSKNILEGDRNIDDRHTSR